MSSARFGPDGRTVVYGATFGGRARVWLKRPEAPDSVPFELDSAELLSISSVGELAIKLQPVSSVPFMTKGTLARMPLAGGAPRLLIENVSAADWAPDGSDLAVVREFREKSRLEFPPGHVLFETARSDPLSTDFARWKSHRLFACSESWLGARCPGGRGQVQPGNRASARCRIYGGCLGLIGG